MIPPRPSLFALLAASFAVTACATPPPDFHTYHLGEVPPAARTAKAHQHHPQQEHKGQNTTASPSHKKTPATVPPREPLARWWLFKSEPAPAQGQRAVAKNSHPKPQPTAAPNKRAVTQTTKPKAASTPSKHAITQNPKARPQPAPAPAKRAVFENKKPQATPPPARQPAVAKTSRSSAPPIAAQSQQPPARRDHPERAQARSVAASQYPTGKKSSQDGYVVSPYTHAKINVKRVPHGAQVLDPSSEKVFINP
jgi:hypothetical protein